MLTKTWTLLTLTLLAFTLTACSSGGGGPVQGNPPKVATFAATPNPATAGEAVTFTWTVSGDLDSCQLDTDDGKVFDLDANTCRTTTIQAYTYATAGTYSASFLAEGATEASRKVDVVVQPKSGGNPPPANGQDLVALINYPQPALSFFTYSAPDPDNELPATKVPITNTGGDVEIADVGPDGNLYGLTEEGDDIVIYTLNPDTGRATRGAVVKSPVFSLIRSAGDISPDGFFWLFSPGRRDIYLKVNLQTGEATEVPRPSFASDDVYASRGQAVVSSFAFQADGSALYIDDSGSSRLPVLAVERPAGSGTLRTIGLLNTDVSFDAFEVVNGKGYAANAFDIYTVDIDPNSPTAGTATLVADFPDQIASLTTLK